MNKSKEKLYPIKIDGLNSIEDREYFHEHLLKVVDILSDRMKNDHRQEYLEAIYFINDMQQAFSPHNERLNEIVLEDIRCALDLELYNIGITTAIALLIGTNEGENKVDIYELVFCLCKLNKAFSFTWERVRNQRKLINAA